MSIHLTYFKRKKSECYPRQETVSKQRYQLQTVTSY